jgi:HTH-type transcriptional regulator, sugar sensing transcriptional regulator
VTCGPRLGEGRGIRLTEHQQAVRRLIDLGFSQYEAQAYVGLVGREPMTGYALSNITGVPQPKVYETLHRLAAKGVVAATGGEPVRFAAVPAAQLLTDLESSFRERLTHAQRDLDRLSEEPEEGQYRMLRAFSAWASIEKHAVKILDGSKRHVYVSVNCTRLQAIAAAISRADDRGVTLDVLHFGRPVVRIKHGRTVAHDSTRGVIYRRHQARHVAIVGDSEDVMWAVAEDGVRWQSLVGQDHLLAALAKGYIRHDIYVQQIWNDFHDVLEQRYGPGMQRLVGDLAASANGPKATDAQRGRSASTGK